MVHGLLLRLCKQSVLFLSGPWDACLLSTAWYSRLILSDGQWAVLSIYEALVFNIIGIMIRHWIVLSVRGNVRL